MVHINGLLFSIKQGVKSIWRNKMFSLASVATMSACIFLFGMFFAIAQNFQFMVKEAESNVAVTVFFDEDITQAQIDDIGSLIEKRAEVSDMRYVSADEAWAGFKETYFEGSEELAEGFANDNPLANSANYEIYLNDVSMQPALVTYLESIDGIRQVNKSEVAANAMTDFNKLVGYVTVGIIAILLLVSIFLISNTINVGISSRREEIAIMKLIGATDYFVRAPFIVEGVLIGLLGSAIPIAILYAVYDRMILKITGSFTFLKNVLNFVPSSEIFAILTPVALILGVGIGFVGSTLTVKKHINV